MSSQQLIEVVRGEEVKFDIFLYDEDGRPFPLTAYDDFKVCLKKKTGVLEVTHVANANGSVVAKQAPDELGHLQVTIKAADSLDLKADRTSDIQLVLSNQATPAPRIKVFENALSVLDPVC